jgi:DNA-binding MarR family transcriptional regulator
MTGRGGRGGRGGRDGREGRDDPIELALANWRGAGWEAAASGMAAATSVIRVQQLMLQRIDRVLEPFGLTFARYEVLMLLGFSRTGALPPGKAGERLQVHPASVTNAINRLEHDGLVTRLANPRDGRSVLVEITDAGRAVAAAASDDLNAQVFEAMPLPDDGLDVLSGLLTSLRAGWGDFDG